MKLIQKHKFISVFLIVLLFIIALLGWEFYQSKSSLTCASYKIQTDKIQEPVRIVHLTDLHNSLFGEDNQKLVNLVAEQSPDIILLTGDLLNSDEDRTDIATDLISNLGSIARVYVSLGNHEVEYERNYGADIVRLYKDAGAVVLDKQYQDLEVNGQQIRLGGIYGYCLPAKYLASNEANPEECAFLEDFQETDRYSVLMCHMPVCWLINDGLDEWDVDCIFSGHVHGGQIVLPGIGGIYAPDMGWFPGELQGLYSSSDGKKTMVLSRGLGSTEKVPRFNNIPEIVTLDIEPE